MAKNKRSKILAMALCASVMTGIYASPVMAAGQISGITLADASTTLVANDQIFINGVELSGDAVNATGGNFTQLTVTNGMGITGGVLTVGGTSIDSTNGNTVVGGTLTATGAANLNGGLTVKGGLNVNDGPTVIDGGRLFANKGLTVSSHGISIEAGGDLSLEDGNVDVGGTLDVNGETTLAGLTAGATTVDSLKSNGNAEVGGTLAVTGDTTLAGLTAGATTVDSLTVNGAATVDSLEVAKGIEAANGKFQLTEAGVLTVNGEAAFTKGVTVQNGLSVTGGASVDGDFAVTNGGLSVSGGESVLNGGLTVNNGDTKLNGKLDVGAGNFKVDTAGNTEFNGNLNIGHDAFEVTAADGSFSAARDKFNVFADGSFNAASENFKVSADGVINADSLYLQTYGGGTLEVGEALQALTDAKLPDKVGGIERNPAGAGDPGNGTTTIENGAEFTGTAMTMGDTIVESGKITVGAADNQTVIEGGAITAESLTLASLDDREVGAVVNALEQKTAGIERNDVTETTTIEGVTSFDANGMSIKDAEGFGTSLGVAGMEITATGGLSTSFTAGGATFVGVSGTTTINGGAIETSTINGVNFSEWHDEVDGRLDVLEDKTQNIKPGAGTGTGTGEGGTAAGEGNNIIDVPATEDGHTGINGDVTVGGDITAGTGNIGDVGMEEGTITTGDTTIDGNGINTGNGNFTGDVDIIGDITAGTGNIGDVGMEEGTITTGDTTIDGDGMTVGGEEGTSIKHDEISVGDGGYIGGGDVVSGEGVSLNQTAERVGHLENRVGELEDRVDKVGAMSAAIANLRTMGYDPAAPTEVAVGIGQYRDETGAALGLFHYPNRDFMLSLSVSTAGDEVMGGIGATWKFGRKSPEKVAEIKKAQAEADARRAEEAKLAKAEEMKQAAKEAKIKAQQERHAKLAAERAAQAEAAK